MATGTIQKPLQIETGQATVNAFGTITKNIITRIGNICVFEFGGTANASVSAWTTFITMPVGFRLAGTENSEIQFNGVYNDSNDILVLVIKNGDSVIQSKTAIASGKKLSFSMVYTTGD